ncbi:MAG: hypothetical protein HY236_05230 [Acidobacteria bacterium]|nr:hypothetical protein [Acidobacteriota bacterium]
MTTLMLLLGAVLALGVGVGLTLRRLYRPAASPGVASAHELTLALTCSPQETYRPMSRLFAEQDFAFLAGQPGSGTGLVKRLRRQRRGALRLYLREMRADFQRLYALCRLLARNSKDPSFATLVTQQALSFYSLFLILQLRCALGWFLHVRVDTVDLVTAFDRLAQAARASLPLAPESSLAVGAA